MRDISNQSRQQETPDSCGYRNRGLTQTKAVRPNGETLARDGWRVKPKESISLDRGGTVGWGSPALGIGHSLGSPPKKFPEIWGGKRFCSGIGFRAWEPSKNSREKS